VAPDVDAELPPERTPQVVPSLARWPDEGGEGSRGTGSLSVSGRDTLEGGVMSGELTLTYLPLDSFSLSLSLSLYPVFLLFTSPFLHIYW
jgi:hypothetical protein